MAFTCFFKFINRILNFNDYFNREIKKNALYINVWISISAQNN